MTRAMAVCHPERFSVSRGACARCDDLRRARLRGVPPWQPAQSPTCHPERKHQARGLCNPCYKLTRDDSRRAVLRTHGLTPAAYDQMVRDQDGRCPICGDAPRRLYVDHNHRTGALRGLLCDVCNRAIGQLRDDPVVLRRAAEYLEKHTAASEHQTDEYGLTN